VKYSPLVTVLEETKQGDEGDDPSCDEIEQDSLRDKSENNVTIRLSIARTEYDDDAGIDSSSSSSHVRKIHFGIGTSDAQQ